MVKIGRNRQNSNKSTGLDRASVDQIRLDLLDNTPQTQNIPLANPASEIYPAHPPTGRFLLLPAQDGLPFAVNPLQANVEHIMAAISNCRKEAVVVRGVIIGKIKDFHTLRAMCGVRF